MSETRPLLEVRELSKDFPVERGLLGKAGVVRAARAVSFRLQAREILALVGESGSGKSTIARMVQGLLSPTSGEIFFEGQPAARLSLRERANRVQTIYQDPYASLNPKIPVGRMLAEAVRQRQRNQGTSGEPSQTVEELLRQVGLPSDILQDYPHQFSGGQRQRLGIARALAMRPRLLIADEPVSALDLSIQAQILNLLADLNERDGISILLISHDLAVVRQLADRVILLKDGTIVEEGETNTVFAAPREPYTRTLLSAALPLDAGGEKGGGI